MTDEPERADTRDEEEEARAFILARRARFVRAALAGAALATVACDCAGPQACLEPAQPPGSGGSSGGPEAGPQPCLTPTPETGGSGGAGGSAGTTTDVDAGKDAASSGAGGR